MATTCWARRVSSTRLNKTMKSEEMRGRSESQSQGNHCSASRTGHGSDRFQNRVGWYKFRFKQSKRQTGAFTGCVELLWQLGLKPGSFACWMPVIYLLRSCYGQRTNAVHEQLHAITQLALVQAMLVPCYVTDCCGMFVRQWGCRVKH